MRVPYSPLAVGHVAAGAVAALAFLAWLASGLLFGFDAGVSLALHGMLLGGNLALLYRLRREHRHDIAALHRRIDQLRHLAMVAGEDVPDGPPAAPRVEARRRARRSLIHDN